MGHYFLDIQYIFLYLILILFQQSPCEEYGRQGAAREEQHCCQTPGKYKQIILLFEKNKFLKNPQKQ